MTSATVFTLDATDVPPDLGVTDGDAKLCDEPGCVTPVTKPARGRSPNKCDLHRTSTAKTDNTVKQKAWARANLVEDALCKYCDGIGFVISMVNPIDGKIVADGTPAVIKALVNLGRNDPKWRKALETASAPGKYGELTLATLMGLVIPLMIHHNLLPQFNIVGLPTQKEGV